MTRRRKVRYGFACLVLLSAAAVLGPFVVPHDPDELNLEARRQRPDAVHWLGTDDLGRDLLARLLAGARVSLTIGLCSAAAASAIGVTVGAVAGYSKGWTEGALMRLTDVFLMIPVLPLVLALGVVFQPSILTVIAIIAALGWMETARVVRSRVLALRSSDFVESAVALGAGPGRIVLRHVLPNVTSPIAVAATLGVGRAIIVESAMSFFGVGVQPPAASWGNMLYGAQAAMTTQPWLAVAPGLMILVTVLAVNFAGDGLATRD